MTRINLVKPELFLSNSVAIVAPISKILKNKNDFLIDSYEDVIRFNRSLTKNYESNVR